MKYSQADQDRLVVLLTKEKKNGWFVEIGAHHPITNNNTFLMEHHYQWKGIMIEWDKNFLPLYRAHRRLAFPYIGDATKFNYENLLKTHKFPTEIDYLQIDLDADNRSTLTTLEIFDNTIFDKYTFGVVTFEHDIYRGNFFNTQSQSRNIFEKRGYKRIFSNVTVFFDNKWCTFEDWYAHPKVIDPVLINKILQHPENKDTIVHTKCIDIIQSVLKS